jgi:PAS domain S-box-containing protein
MNRPLKVLIVEDSEADNLLLVRELKKSYEIADERVETLDALKAALGQRSWDVLICDFRLPKFSCQEALKMVKELGLDIPFIIVSSVVGEETVIEMLKAGAHDFILKGNYTRLLPAIDRELQNAEVRQERRLAEENYKTLVECSSDKIFMVDEGLKLVSMNKAGLSWLGKKPEEVIGRDVIDVFPKETAANRVENLKKVFETGRDYSADEELNPGGDKIYLSTILSPVKNSSGKTVSVLGIVRDISARKKEAVHRLYEDLKEVDRMKTEFVSIISHELLTPLTPILGFINMLRDETYGELAPEYKKIVNTIGNNAERLADLIESILDVSLFEGKVQLTLNKEPVTIKGILERLIEIMSTEIEAKKIQIETTVSENFPALMADKKRLNRVLTVLLGNALKFTPEGGEITVNALVKDGSALFQVIDNGIDIAQNNLEKIFGEFFQVDSSATRQVGGIGIGLTIARQIVEAHGGKIWAESKEAGKGSTFQFTLPLT